MQTTSVRDIFELQTIMRNHPSINTGETIRHLQFLVGKHIRVSTDAPGDSPILPQTARQAPFEYLNSKTLHRVILTVDPTKADFTKLLSQQCNGVVFDYPSWDFLSVPAPRFDRKAQLKYLNIDDYNVYTINDGTTVTLYWYSAPGQEGKWRLASSKGLDIGDYKWMGARTYMEAFLEVTKLYPTFDLAKLEKHMCYTVGFRHHDFHPLLTDPAAMWAIQTFNRQTRQFALPNIGIPVQEPTKLPCKTFDYMLGRNQSALHFYFGAAKEIHYGYILKSKIAGNANIILESELYRTIRRMVYHLPKKQTAGIAINASNRAGFIPLRAFLYPKTKQLFIRLFPQFAKNFAEYSSFFKKIEKLTIELLKNPSRKLADDCPGIIATRFAKHMAEVTKINPDANDSASIIHDFVVSPSHLPVFVTCFNNF